MSQEPSKVVKILEVMRLLERETDDNHALSVQDIIEALKSKGVHSERKSIYAYMDQLEQYGLDIITQRDTHNLYHIGNRTFQLAELKLLVDAVQFSKFITQDKSRELIEKLKTLTSIHEAKQLQRDDIVTQRLKAKNNAIYLNVDAIHDAILNKKKLRFRYFDYTLDKTMKFRKNGDFYTMIPVFLCWDDEKYYCVTYHEQRKCNLVFRVDKMRDVSALEQHHTMVQKPEDLERYCTRIFSMFGGEEKAVTMKFSADLIGVILDRFGLDCKLQAQPDGTFTITENVLVSPTFLSWVFQFQDKATIIGPEEVVSQAKTMLMKTLSRYPS